MNIESNLTPDDLPTDTFDVQAADDERLKWRLGGESPTERALGRHEAKVREIAEEVAFRQAEKEASQNRLSERLGEVASKTGDVSDS
ncbi:hypothetical protein KA021_03165 [Candidatus Saccharibacteria bacterium]|nr:hypothetical protein [Candidatus Saccharibacteria bacterium]